MNKPDWSKAPSWSKYLAQDKDGQWFWWEKEPCVTKGFDFWMPGPSTKGGIDRASSMTDDQCENWKETLEPRP